MSRLFYGGVPYTVDVNRLKEKFPVATLEEGRVIPHDELIKIVQAAKASPRYYGVINSWIAWCKQHHGVFMIWEPSVGIKVLAPVEILEHGEKKTYQKIRQTGKAMRILGSVDRARLTAGDQRRYDHNAQVYTRTAEALMQTKRDLAVPPIQSLPRPKVG